MQNKKKEKESNGSTLWQAITLIGNTIALNLLFLISCIPVITIGPAISGLYSSVRFIIRKDSWFAGYKEGFCKDFIRKAAVGTVIVIWLFDTVKDFATAYSFYMDGLGVTPLIVYSIALIPPVMVFAALWPIGVYFDYDFSTWLKKSFRFIFKAPLQVLGTAMLWMLPVAMVLFFPKDIFYLVMVFVAIYFSAATFFSTILLKDPLIIQLLEYREEYPENADTEEEA